MRRADAAPPAELVVRAVGDDGRLLGAHPRRVRRRRDAARSRSPMPSELRNRATAIAIEGEASAGAVLLLDERWRRRPVGIAARARRPAEPLLSGAYYLDKRAYARSARCGPALSTTAAQRRASRCWRCPTCRRPGLPRSARIIAGWKTAARYCASPGPHLAEQPRTIFCRYACGAAAARWAARCRGRSRRRSRPLPRQPLRRARRSADVTVSRQVLAEPTLDLGGKTWARLTDGTPLVTAEQARQGLADPHSHHRRSGLVEPRHLRPLRQHAPPHRRAEPGRRRQHRQAPCRRSRRSTAMAGSHAPAAAETIAAGAFAATLASAQHPPGFYGTEDSRRALNLAPAVKSFAPLPALPPGIERASYTRAAARSISGPVCWARRWRWRSSISSSPLPCAACCRGW